MSQQTSVTIRVSPEFKRFLKRAARQSCDTMTRLVVLAICEKYKLNPAKRLNSRRLA